METHKAMVVLVATKANFFLASSLKIISTLHNKQQIVRFRSSSAVTWLKCSNRKLLHWKVVAPKMSCDSIIRLGEKKANSLIRFRSVRITMQGVLELQLQIRE